MGNQQPNDLMSELINLLGAFRSGGANQYYLSKLLAQIGWDADALSAAGGPNDPVKKLGEKLQEIVQRIDSLAAAIEMPPADFAAAVKFFDDLSGVINAVKGLSTGALGGLQLTPPEPWEQLGADLWSWVAPTYLRVQFPLFYELAALLTVVASPSDLEPTAQVTAPDGSVVRAASAWPQLDLTRFFNLLQSPTEFLRTAYLKGAPLTSANLANTVDRVFPRLAALLSELGMRCIYGMRPNTGPDFGADRVLADKMLTIYLGQNEAGEPYGITLALSPQDADGLGLVIMPFGPVDGATYHFRDWTIEFALKDPNIQGLAISRDRVGVVPDQAQFKEVGFKATKARIQDGPAILLGAPPGSYLRVEDVAFAGHVAVDDQGKPAATFSAILGEGNLVINHLLDVHWQKIELAFDHAAHTMTVMLNDLSAATALVPGAKLKLDLTLTFVNGQTRSHAVHRHTQGAGHTYSQAGRLCRQGGGHNVDPRPGVVQGR